MTFSDLLNDISKLTGMELQSIRPGATITVLDVDTEKGCLLLKTKQGQTRSRPLSELQTIWNELNQKPAVHVEGVLHGSGTSRNQPETILANLPYIEWLKLNNKKHIAFVGKNTHPFGTLKQMSPLDSVGISTLDSKGTNAIKVKTVIVTDNVLDTISTLQGNLAGTVSTVEKGVYTFENEALEALVMSSSSAPLLPGCYPVLSVTKTTASEIVDICDEEYYLINFHEVKLLIRKSR